MSLDDRVQALENVRLSLLRELRERAQVLGKRSVLYYGLSSSQCQQLNEYAERLRHQKMPTSNFAGLKKQLRDATSTVATLRKELKHSQQENADTQRLLSSGRWGNPGYLRNSYDGALNSTATGVLPSGRSMRSMRSVRRGVDDLDTDDEVSALRLTCERLKTELGLPLTFRYDDVGTYSSSHLASARAGMEELERQNEALEAERTSLMVSNQRLQHQHTTLQTTMDQLLDQYNNIQHDGTALAPTTPDGHQSTHDYQTQCYALRGELHRARATVDTLQVRDTRANQRRASQQRTANELIHCTTELLALRRALEASHAELDRAQQSNPHGGGRSDAEVLAEHVNELFEGIADDLDRPDRIQVARLIEAVQGQ